MLSSLFLSGLRSLTSSHLPDDCEIMDAVEVVDTYSSPKTTYPAVSRMAKGRLQSILRVPRTPSVGETSSAIADYIVVLSWDTVVGDNALIRVNGGGVYFVQSVSDDKGDRTTKQCYCYKFGGSVV